MVSRAMVGLVAYHRADALHNLARPVARPFRRARVEHDDIGHGARFANRSLDSRGTIGHNLTIPKAQAPVDTSHTNLEAHVFGSPA